MNDPLEFDAIKVRRVSGGRLRIDGGNMFGVIPRVMWERVCTPDSLNRVLLETNCWLVESAGKHLLIDAGYGSKANDQARKRQGLESGNPIVDNLAAVGLDPSDIDMVVLTHLHFDHAGGCTRLDDQGRLRLVFERAEHFVQADEWEDATADAPELAGAYFQDDFVPIEAAGQLTLVRCEAEPLRGVHLRPAPGHTRGQQVVGIGSDGHAALCTADLCPFAAHLPTFWNMAYDQFPLEQRRQKLRILGEAAERNSVILFDHDPKIAAATIRRDERRQFAVDRLLMPGTDP